MRAGGREVVGMAEIGGVAGKVVRWVKTSDEVANRIEIRFADDTCLHFGIVVPEPKISPMLHGVDGEEIAVYPEAS